MLVTDANVGQLKCGLFFFMSFKYETWLMYISVGYPSELN